MQNNSEQNELPKLVSNGWACYRDSFLQNTHIAAINRIHYCFFFGAFFILKKICCSIREDGHDCAEKLIHKIMDELRPYQYELIKKCDGEEFVVPPSDIVRPVWEGFIELNPNIDADDELISEFRQGFFCGAMVVVYYINEANDPAMSVDDGRAIWLALQAELQAFTSAVYEDPPETTH